MKKERFQIILLIAIIMFGTIYAYFKFLFLPQWTDIEASANRLRSLENQYQELLIYRDNPSKLQEEIKTAEAKVKQLSDQLPDRLDTPPIMVGLYNLAKQHFVYPQSIAFEEVQTKGTYQEMGMRFSCQGKTTDLLALIHDLQFGRSQQLAIKTISLTGTQLDMRADLQLKAFGSIGNSKDSTLQPPDFMNSPFGVDSPEKIFQP